MPTGSTFANELLKLIFQAVAIANVADNAVSAPLASLFYSLNTADPTAGGNQGSNEIVYTGYTRATVARTAVGHTVTTNVANPAAAVNFPAGTGGGGVAAFFTIGKAVSGASEIFYTGAVSPTITCGNGVTPQLTTSTSVTLT